VKAIQLKNPSKPNKNKKKCLKPLYKNKTKTKRKKEKKKKKEKKREE